ncbi:uncharacterized protein LOC134459805 [Engraulis encrasicolus]|uniref:uncharacterized protein LOC134459805 n=1 Tax=Engraulis encrasicolus TaxID=184585 RepID=UPI002FD09D1F
MEDLFPSQGIFWMSLLMSFNLTLSDEDLCVGLKPVIVPPRLVVQYGESASATCSVPQPIGVMGWKTPAEGAMREYNVQSLQWVADRVTDWRLESGVSCFTASEEHGECSTHLPITIYKIPESVTIRVQQHTGPLLEGERYNLECEAEGVAPVRNVTVLWFRGGQMFAQSRIPPYSIRGYQSGDDTFRNILTFTALRLDHGAFYSCAARLDLNTSKPIPVTRSNSILLEVLFKTRGQDRTLEAGDPRVWKVILLGVGMVMMAVLTVVGYSIYPCLPREEQATRGL